MAEARVSSHPQSLLCFLFSLGRRTSLCLHWWLLDGNSKCAGAWNESDFNRTYIPAQSRVALSRDFVSAFFFYQSKLSVNFSLYEKNTYYTVTLSTRNEYCRARRISTCRREYGRCLFFVGTG